MRARNRIVSCAGLVRSIGVLLAVFPAPFAVAQQMDSEEASATALNPFAQ